MRKIIKIAAVIITLIAAPQTPFAQSPARLLLRTNAVIRKDVVSVADLLPPSASDAVRAQTKDMALGDAPRAGSHRTFDRADIMRAVQRSAELTALLEIPSSITITRWSRPLTREEVAAAIRKSLEANDVSSPQSLSAEDVKFDSPITVTEREPSLTVMRLESRSANAGTHVALWTASEPRTPPFWVTVDKEIDEPSPASQGKAAAASKAAPKTQIAASALEQAGTRESAAIKYATRPAISAMSLNHASVASESPLIRVGNPIQLIVQGSGMRITAKATALETGREGQQIRVKCEPTGKVLVARAVAARLAEIDY